MFSKSRLLIRNFPQIVTHIFLYHPYISDILSYSTSILNNLPYIVCYHIVKKSDYQSICGLKNYFMQMSITHKIFNIFILLLHYNVSTVLCHTCRKRYSICLKSSYAINRIHLNFLYLYVDTCYCYTKIFEVMQEPHSRLLKLQIISGIFCYLVIANNFCTHF